MHENKITDDVEHFWRANTYSLLARLLSSPPDNQLLETLSAIDLPTNEHAQPLARAWKNLAVTAAAVEVNSIADEYQQLFIGITRGELLPYASFYLSGFLMEKPLALLREDLGKLGMQRQDNVHEPEDHAAALCEVMSLLIQDHQSTESGFFMKHLAPWLGLFFADLKQAEAANFYCAVAELGTAFFDFEKNYLVMPE